jgi:hypothetical protein
MEHSHPQSAPEGFFHRLLLPGSYRIRVEAQGYETMTQSVVIGRQGLTRLSVELEPTLTRPGQGSAADESSSGSSDLSDGILALIVLLAIFTGPVLIYIAVKKLRYLRLKKSRYNLVADKAFDKAGRQSPVSPLAALLS